MRRYLLLFAGFVFCPLLACAQMGPVNATLFASNTPAGSAASADPSSGPATASASVTPAASVPAAPAAQPQTPQGTGSEKAGVTGVFRNFYWQIFGGYAFTSIHEVPGSTVNDNGFNYGLNFYPTDSWFGGDGEFMATFGTQHGAQSITLLGMGGPKVRWLGPRGIQVWAHGLAGRAHFSPQSAYGSEGAVGYEAGAGVDLTARRERLSIRLEGDLVGTRLFGTSQYSPKIGVGLVYEF